DVRRRERTPARIFRAASTHPQGRDRSNGRGDRPPIDERDRPCHPYLTLTYFLKFCVPTSAAKMLPASSAAMPEAEVPRTTLSRSEGSGIKALSDPSLASPITMPLSSPFLAVGSGKEAPT